MSNKLLLKNMSIVGPAGAQGPSGPTGPAAVVVKLANTADGSTVANTVAPTGFTPVCNFAANELYVGKRLRITGHFVFSTTGTPTLGLAMCWGGGSVQICNEVFATANNSSSDRFSFSLDIVIRSVGAAGTSYASGAGFYDGNAGESLIVFSQNGPSTFDTTIAQSLLWQATWGTASPSNTVTLKNFFVEALN